PAAGPATGPGPAAAGESPGNFMEDEQWLSSISQYGGRIKHWNRFRDVSPRRQRGGGRRRRRGGP
uniref:Uncharacterized protein n=1 Tax=Otus sunia TaxID=257818 RepID=A0A8C8AEK5_9STRI